MSMLQMKRICWLAVITLGLSTAAPANAQGWDDPRPPGRLEIGLGISAWPSLTDLEPLGNGSFDELGLGISGGYHVQVTAFEDSELLLGVDGSFHATEGSILGLVGTYSANHIYLGGSARWRIGERRNMLLDTGLGYHLVDISEIDFESGFEGYVNWEESAVGAYVGATYDIGRADAFDTKGAFVSFKVHFVDFGTVYDQGNVIGVLGRNAGRLSGPIYQVQFGYGGS